MIEFKPWGKTPRLFRDIVITEKIDGTNSAVIIEPATKEESNAIAFVHVDDTTYAVGAQSKNRLIFPGKTTDNYGFAAWVEKNAEVLVRKLGVGTHFGEWWGDGVTKRYNVNYRVFSLFNTAKWAGRIEDDEYIEDLYIRTKDSSGRFVMVEPVPVLYQGEFGEGHIKQAAAELLALGSVAAPCERNPEGLVVYHTQSKQVYKFTFDNNDKGKWEALRGTQGQD